MVTKRRQTINYKVRAALRSTAFSSIHRLCKSSRQRGSQRGVLRSDQVRILDENALRMPARLEQQLGVLRQRAEPQPRHAGLPGTEQLSRPAQREIFLGNAKPVGGRDHRVEAAPPV